jgi:hypothetical protein
LDNAGNISANSDLAIATTTSGGNGNSGADAGAGGGGCFIAAMASKSG